MWYFMQKMNKKYGLQLQTYDDLHRWSIENINDFWNETWYYVRIHAKNHEHEVGQFAMMVT